MLKWITSFFYGRIDGVSRTARIDSRVGSIRSGAVNLKDDRIEEERIEKFDVRCWWRLLSIEFESSYGANVDLLTDIFVPVVLTRRKLPSFHYSLLHSTMDGSCRPGRGYLILDDVNSLLFRTSKRRK